MLCGAPRLRLATWGSSACQACLAWLQALASALLTWAALKRVSTSSSALPMASRTAGRRAPSSALPLSMLADKPLCTCISCTSLFRANKGAAPVTSRRAEAMSFSEVLTYKKVGRALIDNPIRPRMMNF